MQQTSKWWLGLKGYVSSFKLPKRVFTSLYFFSETCLSFPASVLSFWDLNGSLGEEPNNTWWSVCPLFLGHLLVSFIK